MEYRNIERLHNVTIRSLFTVNGSLSYERITDCIIRLADLIATTETDELAWSIGEFQGATLDSLIVGAYWHYVDYHGGQSSREYAALSAISGIFDPGIASGPEPESGELIVYEMLSQLVENQ